MTIGLWLTALAAALSPVAQAAAPLTPDESAFRDMYREFVETNTTRSAGSCTALSEKIRARLIAAGYPQGDVQILTPPEHPKWGNLVAILHGRGGGPKPLLLLAHLDVVEADRKDWARDPFVLTEEDGMLYGRGVSDDKAQAAVWVDSLIRLRRAGIRPRRDIKMALTCGEETPSSFDGAEWLAKEHRPLIDAAFALNEGAKGLLDDKGHYVSLSIQDGEKIPQTYLLETTNPGGHSSMPVKDNAIYRLSAAMLRLQAYDFPIRLSGGTRGYFAGMAPLSDKATGDAMRTMLANPVNTAAAATLSQDKMLNSMMRTTCVATMLTAGHAANALPQRATATVNCRILPDSSVEEVRKALVDVVADPEVSVTPREHGSPSTPPPPLSDAVLGPVKTAAAQIWPGVPVIPFMATSATDGRYLNAAGIPTYGVTGFFHDEAGPNAHGLNEHIRVRSLFEGRAFLYRLITLYANAAR